MSRNITFSAADQAVMIGILKQIEVGKIDNEKLRVELGLPTKNAASVRVSRLKAKLARGAGAAEFSNMTTPKSKSIPSKARRGSSGSSAKKRKISMSDTEDEEEDEVDMVIPREEGDGAGEGASEQPVLETPTRRLPQRKARVISFKEETSEEEVGEDLFEDLGAGDAGMGSGESEVGLVGSPSDDEV